MKQGIFIAIEGIDGSGKTTQVQRLADWLPTSGLMSPGAELVVTREPGGTALGQALRTLLLDPPAGASLACQAELLLYAADRAQHVAERIAPALAAGHWVLSDRFSGSTVAYQGYGRGVPLWLIQELDAFATGGLRPDLTLWLDVIPEEAMRRLVLSRSRDRIEAEGEEFLQSVCYGYAEQAWDNDSWIRIGRDHRVNQVHLRCREKIQHFLASRLTLRE